jgi:aminoglycoside 6'-N-acetyltransferase I
MDVLLLTRAEMSVLDRVADEVFDDPIDAAGAAEFLADPRHHICVAIEDGLVVGFASAVHYVHPDKPASELWINEVGVSPAYRQRGVAKAILAKLLAHAKDIGCREAWVLTDEDNAAARALYRSAGGKETRGVVEVDFQLS